MVVFGGLGRQLDDRGCSIEDLAAAVQHKMVVRRHLAVHDRQRSTEPVLTGIWWILEPRTARTLEYDPRPKSDRDQFGASGQNDLSTCGNLRTSSILGRVWEQISLDSNAQSRTLSPSTSVAAFPLNPPNSLAVGESDEGLTSPRDHRIRPLRRGPTFVLPPVHCSFNSAAPPPPIDHGCLWNDSRGESPTLTDSLCEPGWSI